MTKEREALKLALEALETRCGTNAEERGPNGAITRIKEALAQPGQEPPSEWALIKNILDEHGLQAISFVADWKAAQRAPECPIHIRWDTRGVRTVNGVPDDAILVQNSRWYCIDKNGMATLCADEDDAKQNAKLADQNWPNNAPYRAVQLCAYTTPQPENKLSRRNDSPLTDEEAAILRRLQQYYKVTPLEQKNT